LSQAVWPTGEESADCCAFRGGPYTERRCFGEGVGIAVREEDADLRPAMDWALARLDRTGQSRRRFPARVFAFKGLRDEFPPPRRAASVLLAYGRRAIEGASVPDFLKRESVCPRN
jgi:hypothetical protein